MVACLALSVESSLRKKKMGTTTEHQRNCVAALSANFAA